MLNTHSHFGRLISRLRDRNRRLAALVGVVGILFVVMPPPLAGAHGEQSQQAFERTSTVLFYDDNFSTRELNIGDDLTITGTFRVMESWPDHTIQQPDLGFLTVNMPGPVFFVQDREINGMFTPQSVKLVKGAIYPFKIVLKARVPGTWHIHPAMAMEGTGTLVGPGESITIREGGTFTQPQQLSDGRNVDLATYGLSRVVTWHVIGLLVAVLYVAYFLRKSLLQRNVAVTEGREASLLSRTDVKVGVAFAGLAMVVGIAGYAYANASDGHVVPIQVARYEPPPAEPSALTSQLESKVQSAVFQEKTGELVMKLSVKNNAPTPVTLDRLQFADYDVLNKDGASTSTGANLATVTPAGPILPGETKDLSVVLDARELASRNLLPLNEAQVRITGLMFFRDSTGQKSTAEINELTSGILPEFSS